MNSKRFIVGFLVVVAVIGAVSIYVNMTTERAARSIAAVASPDGRLKAVKTTLSSAGAAPFCFDTIVVLPTIYPDDFHAVSYTHLTLPTNREV